MTERSQYLTVFNHKQGARHQDVTVFADAADALRADDAAKRHIAEQERRERVAVGFDSAWASVLVSGPDLTD